MYVGMATLADWEAFGAAVSALPGLLWAQVVVLSLVSYLLRFSRWHHFIVALGHKVDTSGNWRGCQMNRAGIAGGILV